MQFKYAPLEIDLIREVEERDMRAKYAEMGLVYDSEPEVVDDGMPEARQIDFDFGDE